MLKILFDGHISRQLRQEKTKERLSNHRRELDVPLLVEWQDGRREILWTNHTLPTLRLGSDRRDYLRLDYIMCQLGNLDAAEFEDSDNVVARVNLPNMYNAYR